MNSYLIYFRNMFPMIFCEFLQLLVSSTANYYFSPKKQLISIEHFIIDFSIFKD